MHGLVLIYVLRDMPQIERFKIVQHDLHRIQVLIVPAEGYAPSIENKIREEFRRRLGADTEVLVSPVQDIRREASGKYRYVVSHASATIGVQASVEPEVKESIGA